MQRELLLMRHEPRGAPERHRRSLHRLQTVAIAAASSRIVAADCFRSNELAGPIVPRPVQYSGVRRRIEEGALQGRHRAIDSTLTPTRHPRQGILGSGSKGYSIGWRKRTGKTGDQGVSVEVVKCCGHGPASLGWIPNSTTLGSLGNFPASSCWPPSVSGGLFFTATHAISARTSGLLAAGAIASSFAAAIHAFNSAWGAP